MRRWIFIVLLALSPRAGAAEFTPDRLLSPGVFSFDTPGGHYQSFKTAINCSLNTVRGIPKFTRWEGSTQWTPSVSIALGGGGSFITLFLFSPKEHSSFYGRMLRAAVGHKDRPLEDITFSKPVPEREASFSVTWTRDGVVTAKFGNEEHTMRLGARVEEVEIGGVSGAGTIRGLEIGHLDGVDADGERCGIHLR